MFTSRRYMLIEKTVEPAVVGAKYSLWINKAGFITKVEIYSAKQEDQYYYHSAILTHFKGCNDKTIWDVPAITINS